MALRAEGAPDQPGSGLEGDKSNIEILEPKLDQIVERKVQVAMRTVTYSGPMPPPEHLAQYDKIVPGAARMILDEFQANSRHAREMELKGMSGMIGRDARAQWMAFVLVLIAFYLIWQLASTGHDKLAIAVATFLVGGIVAAFLTGHSPWSKGKKPDSDDEPSPKTDE
ncbi:DUF2335 domain-containing protein [Paraburkholderia fungorum]|uniref:DUF2335 domain-containing protein n=1 Tax=Paraburkholderia fungorum TaxID=134537 RepID=UPI0038B8E5A5